MKKTLIVLFASVLIISCNNQSEEEPKVDTEAIRQEILQKIQDSLANVAILVEEKRIQDSLANVATKPVIATQKTAPIKNVKKTSAVKPKPTPKIQVPPTKQEEQAKKLEDKFGGAQDKNNEQEVKKQEQKLKSKFGE